MKESTAVFEAKIVAMGVDGTDGSDRLALREKHCHGVTNCNVTTRTRV